MAHEIEQHDGIVLHQQRAWHGLGVVVADAPTPTEALRIAGLDWQVEQWAVSATDGQRRLALEDYRLNVRTDVVKPLGMVGPSYRPIQNAELADFCQLLAEQGDAVKVESAGSIRNGQKVWFLLKGESFTVRKTDDVSPYILVSNGHDGITALRCTPTTVRVVCSNTLHMVIPGFDMADRGRIGKVPQQAAYVTSHVGDVRAKVEAAKAALGLYGRALDKQREVIDHLAARELNHEGVARFLTECYARHFGAIPANPEDDKQWRERQKALDSIGSMLKRFEREIGIGGATAWNALNAYTGWLQHDRPLRVKDAEKIREARLQGSLFGTDGDRAVEALGVALAL